MEKRKPDSGSPTSDTKPAPKSDNDGKVALNPCEKAFHQETARLGDKDEACDDGVR